MKSMRAKDIDGEMVEFKVGGFCAFKCDIEQSGEILDVRPDRYNPEVLVEVNEGGYGHGKTWIPCDRCWDVE